MDTRIGFPNEHLAGDSPEELSSPLYATAVGLMMNSIRNNTKSATPIVELKTTQPVQTVEQQAVTQANLEAELEEEKVQEEKARAKETTESKIKRSFFDKYIDKLKEFLDNAE
jgi:cell division protein FtsA